MVRDKQHGPVIELNRIHVKRTKGGLAGVDGMKSVFGQMVNKLHLLTSETLSLPHRVWKVKFVGKLALISFKISTLRIQISTSNTDQHLFGVKDLSSEL